MSSSTQKPSKKIYTGKADGGEGGLYYFRLTDKKLNYEMHVYYF